MIAVAASMRPIAALHVLLALWMSRACCANSVVSQINTRAWPPISVSRSILDFFCSIPLIPPNYPSISGFFAVMWMRKSSFFGASIRISP